MRKTSLFCLDFSIAVICYTIFIPFYAFSEINNIEWEKLSDRDISPKGRAALSIGDTNWKHFETEHFVYHFTDEKQAETVFIHAEIYYKWIKELFGIEKDTWSKKNRVFIFSDDKAWQAFKDRVGKQPKTIAFTDGWELFIYRDPHYLEARKDLAHEITHVIVFRFLDGPVPLCLDEGLAEFISMRALAMQTGKMEFDLRPLELIGEGDFIPIEELFAMTTYPKEKSRTFYDESDLFVRFLIFTYKGEKFYEFLGLISRGGDFKKTVSKIYGVDSEGLQAKFKKYAIKK
jgi:hypothetical protein